MATISFKPVSVNVVWDGVSEAKLSLDLSCFDTAATYVAKAHRVMPTGGTYVPENTSTLFGATLKWAQGDRYFLITENSAHVPALYKSEIFDVTVPSTVSGGTATLMFSGMTIGAATSTSAMEIFLRAASTATGADANFRHAAFSWWLEGTKAGTKKVFVAGRLDVKPQNAYEANLASTKFVSGVTAYGCF